MSALDNATVTRIEAGDSIMMGAGLGCWLLELSYSTELFPWTLLIKLKDRQVSGHLRLKQATLYPPST